MSKLGDLTIWGISLNVAPGWSPVFNGVLGWSPDGGLGANFPEVDEK